MERVRQATTEDLDRLVELVAGFVADRARHRGGDLVRDDDAGGVSPEPVVGSLGAYVSDPGRTALVGTLDDWVAGAALCRVDDGGAGRRGVLDLCFVESGAREVGLGHLLLDEAPGVPEPSECLIEEQVTEAHFAGPRFDETEVEHTAAPRSPVVLSLIHI